MKKLSILCMTVVLAGMSLVSCVESSEKQEKALAYKIENHEELTSDDYSTMIEYVGEYAEKAQKYVDMQINGDNLSEAAEGMAKLKEEYPLLDVYRNCIRFTAASELSPENLKKVGEYAGYIEFTAPSGYTLQTDPKAEGMEVAAPDSVNGVVAGAVDNVKVEDKPTW